MLYLLILILKVFEVTLTTMRIVLITKGERLKGAIIGFIQVLVWVVLASTVLVDVSENPMKAFMYAFGFGLGSYIGSILVEKIGVGTARVELIVKEEHGEELVHNIRQHGFGVTLIKAKGMNHSRNVLISHIKRKRTKEFINIVKSYQKNVVITVSDIKPIYGGYGISKNKS